MTVRRLFMWATSLAFVAIGLLALSFPVFLDSFDQWGIQLKCGTGFSTEPIQAAIADEFNGAHPETATHPAKFSERCQHALTRRRTWAILTAAVGGIMLTWLVISLWKPLREQKDQVSSPD